MVQSCGWSNLTKKCNLVLSIVNMLFYKRKMCCVIPFFMKQWQFSKNQVKSKQTQKMKHSRQDVSQKLLRHGLTWKPLMHKLSTEATSTFYEKGMDGNCIFPIGKMTTFAGLTSCVEDWWNFVSTHDVTLMAGILKQKAGQSTLGGRSFCKNTFIYIWLRAV